MPKYRYRCLSCRDQFDVVHGIYDEQGGCPLCFHAHVKKVPQMPHLPKKASSKGGKVGDEVKRAIEENRGLLNEEKKKRTEYKDGN